MQLQTRLVLLFLVLWHVAECSDLNATAYIEGNTTLHIPPGSESHSDIYICADPGNAGVYEQLRVYLRNYVNMAIGENIANDIPEIGTSLHLDPDYAISILLQRTPRGCRLLTIIAFNDPDSQISNKVVQVFIAGVFSEYVVLNPEVATTAPTTPSTTPTPENTTMPSLSSAIEEVRQTCQETHDSQGKYLRLAAILLGVLAFFTFICFLLLLCVLCVVCRKSYHGESQS